MSRMARNCRPTRQRISVWLKLGLVPLSMFHSPASSTKKTARTAAQIRSREPCPIVLVRFVQRLRAGAKPLRAVMPTLPLQELAENALPGERLILSAQHANPPMPQLLRSFHGELVVYGIGGRGRVAI